MSTQIITKTKVSIGAVKPSQLIIAFDPNIPAGTEARAEVTPSEGYVQPELFIFSAEPEVQGEVYVLLDGAEHKLLDIDENSSDDVDVNEAFGELLTKKLILVGKTKVTTTDLRKVILYYTGGIYEFR
jgi:hypothetical protein